ATTPELRPITSIGVAPFVLAPSPSWPYRLYPQHFRPPLLVMAQVCKAPAATTATSEVRPITSTGVALSIVVPSPNWPKSLRPQHLRPPASVRPHVWAPPAATAAT